MSINFVIHGTESERAAVTPRHKASRAAAGAAVIHGNKAVGAATIHLLVLAAGSW